MWGFRLGNSDGTSQSGRELGRFRRPDFRCTQPPNWVKTVPKPRGCEKPLDFSGAGEGNRTLVSGLGSPHSTIEPHPRGHRHNSYQRVVEAARPEFVSFGSSAEEKQFEPRNFRTTGKQNEKETA